MPADLRSGGCLTVSQWFSYVGGVSFAIPVAFALRHRVRSTPLRIIAVYCAFGLVQSVYLILLSLEGRHNLSALHLFVPVQAVMFLWALALWQARERARVTVLVVIPLYLIAWIALTLTVESFTTFPMYVKILEGLLVISVGAYTLLTRSQQITGPVTAYPWFWVSAALVMYLSFGAIVNPVSSLLLPQQPERVVIMSMVNGILLIVCNLLFAVAMTRGAARAPSAEALAAAG